MGADEPFVQFRDGFRRTVEVELGHEANGLDHSFHADTAVTAAGRLLTPPDLLLCFAPLLRRWLPVESVQYHSLHVEFLGLANQGEKVLFEIRVEKQALGKGWKIVVRCRNSTGEYAAVAELLATVPPEGPEGSR
ncbi:MAG: hypothetical protein MUC41_11805 [Syntrophobacteraceae bacterium]|jgi:hypothetical protein|nr:hypothetical protein [Syntrophobacteraceae bacterium]